MKRRIAFVLIVVVATVVAVAWRYMPRDAVHAPVVAQAPTVPATAPAQAAPAMPAAMPARQAIARPAAEQPLPLAYPSLLALAQGGDVDAMFDLGTRMQRCEQFATTFARRFLADQQAELDKFEKNSRSDDKKAQGQMNTLREDIDMRARTIAECEALPEAERRSLGWIEAAALAGHHEARKAYQLGAMEEFGLGAPDLIANIDEVIRRRDLARRFADEETRACVPGAFGTRLEALDRTLGIIEPEQRLAAAQAALLEAPVDDTGKRGTHDLAREYANEATQLLDAAARARAERAGEAMAQQCASRR